MTISSLSHDKRVSLSPIQKLALWQTPLIFILSLDIGWFLWLFWLASWAGSMAHRWWLQLPILMGFITAAFQLVPIKSADFFILILVILLAFTWRIDSQKPVAKEISPAGLCPTIFLVGSVFIYQTQFFILLALVAWLLAFLLWFTMALTGFRLDRLTIRWMPIIIGSFLSAFVIVALFSVIPRINTGFIPGFDSGRSEIGLTDSLEPSGLTDLLASSEVAFRAVPIGANQNAPRYWRVFILSELRGAKWQRQEAKKIINRFAPAIKERQAQFQIITDTHDLSTLPIAGWPADSSAASVNDYGFNAYGEALQSRGADIRSATTTSQIGDDHEFDYPVDLALSADNPRLQSFGRRLRAEFPNEQLFIDQVIGLFARDFTYDLQSNYPEKHAGDAFFFEGKRGHCSYFATALATILRSGGVAAHVAVGYLGGEWNEFGEFWLVNQADAHAWVEVKREDGRWQRLDPTLEVMQMSDERFQGLVDFGASDFAGRALIPNQNAESLWDRAYQAAQFFDSLNLRVTLAIMNYGDNGGADDASAGTNEDRFALFLAIIAIAITILFVAVGAYRLATLNKDERPKSERQLEALLAPWLGMRPAGLSLLHYVRQLEAASSSAAKRAHALASAIYASRFGKTPLDASIVKSEMKELKRELRAVPKAKRP